MIKIPAINSSQLAAICGLMFIAFNGQVVAQTYQWVDKQGVTHITQEPPQPSQVGKKNTKVNPQQIHEKEEYLRERDQLEQQIAGTIRADKREQYQRQLRVLDYNWYKKYDPEKAEALESDLNRATIKVIPKKESSSNMDKMKAFY